jgi:hypothetical protein
MKGLLVLVVLLGCGQSNEDKLREQIERDSKRAPPPSAETKVEKKQLPSDEKKDVPLPDPEPTTPEEIDTARKKAMNDRRDKDVVKYCEMGKVDPAKSDGQVLMGCTLSACRLKEEEKARTWAAGMLREKKDKPLYDQAKKTCLAAQVAL